MSQKGRKVRAVATRPPSGDGNRWTRTAGKGKRLSAVAEATRPAPAVGPAVLVEVSSHAEFRMAQMGVGIAEVEDTLRQPEYVLPDPKNAGAYIAARGRLAIPFAPYYRGDVLHMVTVITCLWAGGVSREDGPRKEQATVTGVPTSPSNRRFYEQLLMWGFTFAKARGDYHRMNAPGNAGHIMVNPPTSNAALHRQTILDAVGMLDGVTVEDFWKRTKPVPPDPKAKRPGGVAARPMNDAELEAAAEALRKREEAKAAAKAKAEAAAGPIAPVRPITSASAPAANEWRINPTVGTLNKRGTAPRSSGRTVLPARAAVLYYLDGADRPVRPADIYTTNPELDTKAIQNAITALAGRGVIVAEGRGYRLADGVVFTKPHSYNGPPLRYVDDDRVPMGGTSRRTQAGYRRPSRATPAEVAEGAAKLREVTKAPEAPAPAPEPSTAPEAPAPAPEAPKAEVGPHMAEVLAGMLANAGDPTEEAEDSAAVEVAPKAEPPAAIPTTGIDPERLEDDMAAVLDLLAPNGFKAGHLRAIDRWRDATRALVAALRQ